MSDIDGKSRSAVSSAASGQYGFGPQLDTFREVRRNLEASILPLATSVDGRRFSFQASLHGLELQVGSYVVLEGGGTRCLGQVLTLELDWQPVTELTLPAQVAGASEVRTEVRIRYARGDGAVLEGDGASFHDVLVRAASGEEVRAWLQRSERRYAKLQLGELALVAGVPCAADASGFDRHTFLCGQSGSGKTYSLGVILERLASARAAPLRRTDQPGGWCRCARDVGCRPLMSPRDRCRLPDPTRMTTKKSDPDVRQP